MQDLRGWYWSDFKPAKKQRQSRIDAVFLLDWKFGGCIRLKVASLGRKWLGKAWGARFEGLILIRFQTSKKTASIQDWCCFFAGLKIWRLYKAKSSFFRQEMAGESVGRKIWGADTDQISNQQKKQRQSRIDAVFLLGWKFGGCIRLKVASLGRKWLGKAWGARFEGLILIRFQTSKKTASIQDWCCFFAGLKIWRLYKAKSSFFRQEMAGESVGCKIWGADTDQISNQQKNSVNPGLMLFFCWIENLEAV